MLAYDYPLLNVVLSMLYFVLFFIWIWIAVMVVVDIFRSHDMGGFAKALWIIFVFFLPYLGVFIYLIVRGGSMHERQARQAQASQAAFNEYVQQNVATAPTTADQLETLAALRADGHLTDQEFAAEKAKLLA
ncbi:SHOCT domain-containing protein [soil metagenome]